MAYFVLALLVFAINLLPAFGPPTWSVLVYARLRWHLDPVALVVVGAAAASLGRYVLASAARALRGHFSLRYRNNLAALAERLRAKRAGLWSLAVLFVISPLPSAQLFGAAGLLDLRLGVLAGAFFAGRLVTYSLYVATAVVVDRQLGSVLANVWGRPWWIALQLLLMLAVTLLPLVPWGRRRPGQ